MFCFQTLDILVHLLSGMAGRMPGRTTRLIVLQADFINYQTLCVFARNTFRLAAGAISGTQIVCHQQAGPTTTVFVRRSSFLSQPGLESTQLPLTAAVARR